MATFIEMIEKVNRDIFNKIERNIDGMIPQLKSEIAAEMAIGMRTAKHYQSLCDGKLAEDFGFIAGQGYKFADSVIEAVVAALQINPPSKTKDVITVDIRAYREDLTDALSAKLAKYPIKGGDLDWLTWLLMRGNDVIIQNWGVLKKGINPTTSRSGKAIMAPVPSPLAISFSVRPDFAGTRGNNWITEGARIATPNIVSVIKKFVVRVVSI